MSDSRRYITLNRTAEWQRGLMLGLEISGNSIVSDGASGNASFVTASTDSTEHDFLWKSFLLDGRFPEGTAFRVSAYAANTTIASVGDGVTELDSFLADKSVAAEKKLEMISPLFKPLSLNCFDGPLGLKGRFLWLKIDMVMPEKRDMQLNKIKLLISSESMMDYLPEIYRTEDGENGFLSRFLAVFDSIFFGLDDNIGKLRESIDYRMASADMLKYLADWVNVEDTAYLSDDKLREKIGRAFEEYRMSGTKHGIELWVEREYGVKPIIVEHYNVRSMITEGKDRETYKRLFGEDPHKFFLLLPEDIFSGKHEANIFMEKLKRRTPAGTRAEVVTLRRSVILERHTYLGINSVISGQSEAGADIGGRISNDIILGGSDDE